jgi:uncharacterized membrane protein
MEARPLPKEATNRQEWDLKMFFVSAKAQETPKIGVINFIQASLIAKFFVFLKGTALFRNKNDWTTKF